MFHWILAIHVIAIISWMAGMLYIWRLYVYHSSTDDAKLHETFQVMERRLLLYITTPAAILALLSGGTMLALDPALLTQPWMHVKLLLVLGLFASHGMASAYRKKLAVNPHVKPDKFFRVMNEIPTLLMIGIVILVVVQPFGH